MRTDLKDRLVAGMRDQKEKFCYYLIALCVASIGFTIYQTSNLPLRSYQIFFGFALTCWGISIIKGFKYIHTQIDNMLFNFNIIDLRGKLAQAEDQGALGLVIANLETKARANSTKSHEAFGRQEYFFYAGIILFLISHIWRMYLHGAC